MLAYRRLPIHEQPATESARLPPKHGALRMVCSACSRDYLLLPEPLLLGSGRDLYFGKELPMYIIQSRRRFLAGLAAAGAAGLIGAPSSARAEPPPETTTVRLPRYLDDDGGCWAALYIAGELLSAEGFAVQYVQGDL